MKLQPKTLPEAFDLIFDVLTQGDTRYNDSEEEKLLGQLMVQGAISLEKREIPHMPKPTEKDLEKKGAVQQSEKYILKTLLEMNGFKNEEIKFETAFKGSRPDVLAKSGNRIVCGEANSCRISKILNYLEGGADEVWVITYGFSPWDDFNKEYPKECCEWFAFKKGKKWEESSKLLQMRTEELKRISSPLETLLE